MVRPRSLAPLAPFFGGVWDYDDGERDLQSEFFNDIYALNLESFRWFPPSTRPE